jgi:hypothetical protein
VSQTRAVLALHDRQRGQRLAHVGRHLGALLGAEQLLRRAAQQGRLGPAGQRRSGLVALDDAQVLRLVQRDGHGRALDDAGQRGLGQPALRLGLAAAVDVQQRIGQLLGDLAGAFLARRLHRVADDPELAPVAAAQLAFEDVGAGLGAVERMVGLVARRQHAHGLAQHVLQLAAEHAPRRAVHPLDALGPHGDDAHQHRVQHRALALGAQ